MKTKMTAWMLGGVITMSAIGFGMNGNISAAEKVASQATAQMMPGDQVSSMPMDSQSMNDMMNSPERQQQCAEMLKNPEMQKNMIAMMKNPAMQTTMKQMLQNNPELLQMMKDLINSVETGGFTTAPTSDMSGMSMDQGAHHM
jgi:protein CpxP